MDVQGADGDHGEVGDAPAGGGAHLHQAAEAVGRRHQQVTAGELHRLQTGVARKRCLLTLPRRKMTQFNTNRGHVFTDRFVSTFHTK